VNKGEIVLVPFPFTDLSQTKLRPAVVLWADTTGNDVTLCFISSQNIDNLHSSEFLLNSSDPEFQGTGLKISSKVRVTRIATVEKSLVSRRLGKLGMKQTQLLNAAMIRLFKLS
jgi:mRNA interferase MazF